MTCLEHVVYQKQSLHMIQIDKDNCNCHIFYEIMEEAVLSVQSPLVCVSLSAWSCTYTDYYVERFIIREEHTHTPAVLHHLVIVESQFAHL